MPLLVYIDQSTENSARPRGTRAGLRAYSVNLYKREHQSGPHAPLLPRRKVPALEVGGQIIRRVRILLPYLGQTELSRATRLPRRYVSSVDGVIGLPDPAGVFSLTVSYSPQTESSLTRAHRQSQKKIRPLLDLLEARLEGRRACGDFSVVDCAYAPGSPSLTSMSTRGSPTT